MKKILIISGCLPIWAQIENKLKDNDIHIVTNNLEVKDNMRMKYLNTYQDLEPILNFKETNIYDKPKSKFHK